jgi:hypothetical protein
VKLSNGKEESLPIKILFIGSLPFNPGPTQITLGIAPENNLTSLDDFTPYPSQELT